MALDGLGMAWDGYSGDIASFNDLLPFELSERVRELYIFRGVCEVLRSRQFRCLGIWIITMNPYGDFDDGHVLSASNLHSLQYKISLHKPCS